MKLVRLVSIRAKLHALFYALLAIWVGVTVHWIDTCHFIVEACAYPKNLLKVVSGTSGAIHGGSSPLERTFCKVTQAVWLTKLTGDSGRSSARGSSPLFAGFCPLFYSLASRGKPFFSLSLFAAAFVPPAVEEQARGRAPPKRRSKRSGNKSRRFGSDHSNPGETFYEVGVPRILSISKATVPRWVRREVVYRALGIGSRTLDDWMARRRMLFRKFPTDNPKNGIVRFPAPWLIGLTGPIEIEVITGEEEGEPLVSREILTATAEVQGQVGIAALSRIHSVCANTVRQWDSNGWISPIELPSGHLRFDAKVVEARLALFDVPAFVPPACEMEMEAGL